MKSRTGLAKRSANRFQTLKIDLWLVRTPAKEINLKIDFSLASHQPKKLTKFR
jgi:hypothetical protein